MSETRSPHVELLKGLVLLALFIPWKGWVLSKLWGWFLVPLGAPRIGVVAAAGVLMVVSFLRPTRPSRPGEDPRVTMADAFRSVLIPAFELGMGYVVHLVGGWAAGTR